MRPTAGISHQITQTQADTDTARDVNLWPKFPFCANVLKYSLFSFVSIYQRMIIESRKIYPERCPSSGGDTGSQPAAILESTKGLT